MDEKQKRSPSCDKKKLFLFIRTTCASSDYSQRGALETFLIHWWLIIALLTLATQPYVESVSWKIDDKLGNSLIQFLAIACVHVVSLSLIIKWAESEKERCKKRPMELPVICWKAFTRPSPAHNVRFDTFSKRPLIDKHLCGVNAKGWWPAKLTHNNRLADKPKGHWRRWH